ncbi:tubulin folding cofactor D C terminal-domain-containing protein [Chlamydoabsidia padenii]|nr:tubulin folding cofactor D C terminal-domain-containing protein [Chlamydoabsidia padenii]
MEDDCIAQTKSHFEHCEQVTQLVDNLCKGTTENAGESLAQLSTILDLYQEQSHLLDPYLENLVTPCMTRLRDLIQQRPIIPEQSHALFRFLYLLTKTRGYKTIVKFMSHEVTDLESVFEFLSNIDGADLQYWETRYISFIWLSLICMIPFDLKRVDSGTGDSLIVKLLDLCKHYLKATGKERDGASLLIARLLSRRDICDDYLVPYVEWSKETLKNGADVFETAGILSSLCILYRLAPRKILLPTLDDSILPLLSMPFFLQYDNNSLIRKLRMKLTQRIGLCYLKPKLASWRYQRGSRSLRNNLEQKEDTSTNQHDQSSYSTTNGDDDDEDISENLEIIIDLLLNGLRDKDTIVRWSAAKGMGRISQRLPQELAEDVIGSLLELFEENTFKATQGGHLDLTAVSDHTWHGASLAVAELARRGLLLPERLHETIPWILLGLKFDLKRGSHSIGAHVRDACCYVCWSFARAYAPEIMSPFVKEIAQNLVVVSVFDREINVRRASSAAFQENVGRQGIFPMGIDIIQLADYFSLGNRTNSFLQVATDIAKFEDYRYHLIDHLVAVTSKHWDKSMRVLASKSLYQLVPLDPIYFMDQVLPSLIPLSTSKDMIISHGALLSLGEICLSIWECRKLDKELETTWKKNENLHKTIASIVCQLPSRSLTTFGSEHIREAACQLIEYMARINLVSGEYNDQFITSWKQVIQTSLERKEENVQEYAVGAFGAISLTYGVARSEVDVYLKKIETTHMMYGRRGYALALGTLDYNMEERYTWLQDVVHKLGLASQIQVDHIANDVEAKRNAVIGLTNILKGLNNTTIVAGLPLDDHRFILDTLELCLKDYSTDQRGDVGSWVRSASMECLRHYIPMVAKSEHGKDLYTLDTNTRLIGVLMKQSVERIDRVRELAGSVLTELVYSDSMELPHVEILKQSFAGDLSFSSPDTLYPVMVKLLSYSEYRLELLTGIIASAGGLTESLVRHASSNLIQYVNSLPVTTTDAHECSIEDIIRTMFEIFARYEKQDRVIIPLMDVIGLLFETGTLPQIKNENIHLKLMIAVKKESFRSKNVKKLLSTIKVYVGLISLNGTQVKTKALQQMLSYLVHGYPRIRMEVADQLFTFLSILDDNDINEGTMQAEEIITGTDWSLSLDAIKPLRDQLYGLLSIPKPVVRSSS